MQNNNIRCRPLVGADKPRYGRTDELAKRKILTIVCRWRCPLQFKRDGKQKSGDSQEEDVYGLKEEEEKEEEKEGEDKEKGEEEEEEEEEKVEEEDEE